MKKMYAAIWCAWFGMIGIDNATAGPDNRTLPSQDTICTGPKGSRIVSKFRLVSHFFAKGIDASVVLGDSPYRLFTDDNFCGTAPSVTAPCSGDPNQKVCKDALQACQTAHSEAFSQAQAFFQAVRNHYEERPERIV